MKKIFTLIWIIFSFSAVYGQQLISKNLDFYDSTANSWANRRIESYVYYPNGKVAEINTELNENGIYNKTYKSTYSYDEVANTCTVTLSSFSFNTQDFQFLEKTQYFYGTSNELVKSIRSMYNTNWRYADLLVYTYDNFGFLTMIKQDEWDNFNNVWVSEFKHDYINNSAGKMMSSMTSYYSNGSWFPAERQTNSFFNSGQVQNTLRENFHNQTWLINSQDHYTYNSIDSLSENLYQYVDNSPALKDMAKYIHSYNPDNTKDQIVEQYRAGPSYWNTIKRTLYVYGEPSYLGGEEPTASFSFDVYPNPIDDILSIQLKNELSVKIALFNVQGKMIFESKITGKFNELDVQEIPAGVYILAVTSDEQVAIRKVVKK